MELKIFFHWSVTKSYRAVFEASSLNLDIRQYPQYPWWHLFSDFHHWCIIYLRKMPFILPLFNSSHTVMITFFPFPTKWLLYLETKKFKEGMDMSADKSCANWWMSPHGIIALLHLARVFVAGHVKDPSQSTSCYISCAKPGLDLLPGVQLVRLRVNKEERSSGWERFWFPRILIENPTGESRNLSALTSFWAWFMICTINVSMLIISWKMDLRGWEIERKSNWRRGGLP